MVRLLALVAVLCAAGVLLLAAPAGAPAAAKPGTIAGSLAGRVPAKGKGEADLRVIALADGRIAAARTLGRAGTFSLRLPAGAYALRTAIVPRRGRGTPVVRVQPVSLRTGQKRRRVTVKSRPRKRSRARSAFVQESGKVSAGTAVSVEPFAGATGDLAVLNRGLAEMLQVDVWEGLQKCQGRLVANSADRKLVEAELDLQKSEYFDPATRVTRDFILPDVTVHGTLTNTNSGGIAYVITLDDTRSGEALDTLTGTLGSDLFDAAAKLGRELGRRLCRQPEAYQLTLEAPAVANVAPAYRATGTAKGLLVARAQDGDADTPPTRWKSEPSAIDFENVVFAGNGLPCTWIPGEPEGMWGVTISATGDGRITVATQGLQTAKLFASVVCAPAPPLGGQAGPALGGIGPETFTLPAGGGKQALSGALVPWSSTGTITVRPSAAPK